LRPSRQTCDETGANRVPHQREDDRDDRRRLLCGDRLWGSISEDHIDFEPDKLGRDLGVALAASLRPAILDGNGAALDPAELAQPIDKSGHPLGLGRSHSRA
jgi:hypothetical protein